MRAAPYTPPKFPVEGLSVTVTKSTTKFTILPNHCQTLPLSSHLITLKMIQDISSPFSLSTPYNSYIVAALRQKLNIGSRSKIYKDSFQNSSLCLRRCISYINIADTGL